MRGLRQAALRTTLWAQVETWGPRLISMAVFLLMARLLLPDAFGVVALAQVYTIVMQALCESGIPAALIQCPVLEEGHKDSAFWANQAVGVALGLLTLALAQPLAALWRAALGTGPALLCGHACVVFTHCRPACAGAARVALPSR